MSRQTTKIPIPKGNPGKFNKLVQDIWRKHSQLGASSPLNDSSVIDISHFEAVMNEALAKREEAEELYGHAQALMQQWRRLMGLDAGQSIETDGTMYQMLRQVKRILLVKYPSNNEELTGWGFHVVNGRSKNPTRKKKAAKKG